MEYNLNAIPQNKFHNWSSGRWDFPIKVNTFVDMHGMGLEIRKNMFLEEVGPRKEKCIKKKKKIVPK